MSYICYVLFHYCFKFNRIYKYYNELQENLISNYFNTELTFGTK